MNVNVYIIILPREKMKLKRLLLLGYFLLCLRRYSNHTKINNVLVFFDFFVVQFV